ncbi:metal-dependent hydrolase [Catenulispora pinisilvae]|uniref:metal-dependent hydrolase n=1 Tax=Catenulispora pinisilvae TaxID=2705253 RepID=UPI001891572A|nr:metal-dependent hydrolase [Catenulispora pinisilvae]
MADLTTTHVTFPAGATTGTATVLAVRPLPAGTGVIVGSTPFHPLDHSWPDQPGDTGAMAAGGVRYAVTDCLTGGVGPDGEFAVGTDIPVRRGEASWQWLAVHVLDGTEAPAPGTTVELRVDEARRAALSASHTGCHLMALALNEALADRWRKEARTDGLDHPDFDSLAMDTSRIGLDASTDRYRLGKSLRKKGFDPEGLREALPELTAKINARLAEWLGQDAPVRIDTPGPELTARRQWVCELPERTIEIACGGTHLHRLGELAALTAELTLSEDGTELVVVTTPKRG